MAQTPPPGLEIPFAGICNHGELLEFIRPLAGELLADYIRDTYLKSPDIDQKEATPAAVLNPPFDNSSLRHAPKITAADREIDWKNWTATDFERRDRVLERLWSRIRVRDRITKQVHEKRVVFQGFVVLPEYFSKTLDVPPDIMNTDGGYIFLVTKPDGKILRIDSMTIEGEHKQAGSKLCSLGQCTLGERTIDIE